MERPRVTGGAQRVDVGIPIVSPVPSLLLKMLGHLTGNEADRKFEDAVSRRVCRCNISRGGAPSYQPMPFESRLRLSLTRRRSLIGAGGFRFALADVLQGEHQESHEHA